MNDFYIKVASLMLEVEELYRRKVRIQLNLWELRILRNMLASEYCKKREQRENDNYVKALRKLLKKLHKHSGFRTRFDAL
jgi:hypothetical protein